MEREGCWNAIQRPWVVGVPYVWVESEVALFAATGKRRV